MKADFEKAYEIILQVCLFVQDVLEIIPTLIDFLKANVT